MESWATEVNIILLSCVTVAALGLGQLRKSIRGRLDRKHSA